MTSLQQAPTVGQQVPPQAVIDGAIEQHTDAAVKAHAQRGRAQTSAKPWIFTSGWRGHLAMHSHELAAWMGVDTDRVNGTIIWQNGNRPESWWIGNCWNKSEVYSHSRSDMTFKIRTSYWISESAAMGACRQFRKELLGQLRQLFADAQRERIERKIAFADGLRESQIQEVSA